MPTLGSSGWQPWVKIPSCNCWPWVQIPGTGLGLWQMLALDADPKCQPPMLAAADPWLHTLTLRPGHCPRALLLDVNSGFWQMLAMDTDPSPRCRSPAPVTQQQVSTQGSCGCWPRTLTPSPGCAASGVDPKGANLQPWSHSTGRWLQVLTPSCMAAGADPQPWAQIPSPGHTAAGIDTRLQGVLAQGTDFQPQALTHTPNHAMAGPPIHCPWPLLPHPPTPPSIFLGHRCLTPHSSIQVLTCQALL